MLYFFVNFADDVHFDESLKQEIRLVLASAIEWLQGASEELRSLDATALAEAVKILRLPG